MFKFKTGKVASFSKAGNLARFKNPRQCRGFLKSYSLILITIQVDRVFIHAIVSRIKATDRNRFVVADCSF